MGVMRSVDAQQTRRNRQVPVDESSRVVVATRRSASKFSPPGYLVEFHGLTSIELDVKCPLLSWDLERTVLTDLPNFFVRERHRRLVRRCEVDHVVMIERVVLPPVEPRKSVKCGGFGPVDVPMERRNWFTGESEGSAEIADRADW